MSLNKDMVISLTKSDQVTIVNNVSILQQVWEYLLTSFRLRGFFGGPKLITVKKDIRVVHKTQEEVRG